MSDHTETVATKKTKLRVRDLVIGILALVVTIAGCVAVVFYWDYISQVRQYGYVGAFVISALAGAFSFIPIPGILVVFTLGSLLNPILVGIVSGLGEALGSLAIYFTGYGGRVAVESLNERYVARLEKWLGSHGSLTVFLMSVILNPLFYPFTALAGMLRFGLLKFFFLCWAGKAIKNTAI
ncbi:MAG: VTT domain-containing protein, partial [Chloroflexi bacterium]|nr:VTT domain-containing protein [Chloroflexota bacterium]